MEREKYQQLSPEEIKKFEEENIPHSQEKVDNFLNSDFKRFDENQIDELIKEGDKINERMTKIGERIHELNESFDEKELEEMMEELESEKEEIEIESLKKEFNELNERSEALYNILRSSELGMRKLTHRRLSRSFSIPSFNEIKEKNDKGERTYFDECVDLEKEMLVRPIEERAELANKQRKLIDLMQVGMVSESDTKYWAAKEEKLWKKIYEIGDRERKSYH